MSTDPRSWLDREGLPGAQPPPDMLHVIDDGLEHYEAFTKPKGAKLARRMWIHLRDGSRHMIEAYPLRITMPNSGMMMISCRTDVITLRGRGLDELVEAISEMKAKAITEFDPDRHREPDEEAGRIDAIELVEMRQLP